jgi:Glycosyl hydrolase family 26
MKSRLIMLMSLAVAALSLILAAGRVNFVVVNRPPVHATLTPSLGSYLGVYEPGSPPGSPPSYQSIAAFGAAVGRQPNLAEIFSGWAAPFDTGFAETLHRHGVIPLVQIDPTDANIAAIAAGDYDDYLRTYADAVADYRHPVVIGFGQEMNASWYSWGYRHVKPSTFVAAWKRIVQVFRSEGADNVTWLWTIQADEPGTGPIGDWWPGPAYVSWVGIDGFYYRPSDSFSNVFGPTIQQVQALTNKPVLLAETAVGPAAGQLVEIQDLFKGVSTYKTLGLVWFDVDQHGGVYHQDWRIENSQEAEYSFRLGAKDDLASTLASGGG